MNKKPILKTRSSKASSSSAPTKQLAEFKAVAQGELEPERISPFESSKSKANKVEVEHKSKTDPIRFSDRRTNGRLDMAPIIRVLTFILVIIVIGFGMVWGVQQFIASQSQQEPVAVTPEPTTPEIPGISISTTLLPDSSVENLTLNSSYQIVEVKVGSTTNTSNSVIEELSYDAYTTFSRVQWRFSELTGGFPAVGFKYTPTTRVLVATFTDVDVLHTEMLQMVELDLGVVDSIDSRRTDEGVQFTLQLRESSKYAVRLLEAENTILVDIKSDLQLSAPSSTSSTTSSAQSSSETSSATSSSVSSASSSSAASVPTGNNFNNTASQSPQNVVSPVTGASVKMMNYYFQDFGPKFDFGWGFEGTGVNSIPNAQAKYIQVDGKNYIEVVIKNLSQDIFYANGWNKASFGSVNMSYANVVDVHFRERTGNESTYWVEVKRVSNYRLHSTTTKNDQQVLTIEVFD